MPTAPAFGVPIDLAHFATLGLTPRESEVMQWICEGKRDREIAIILGLSARTVQKHVAHIFEKLEVETRTAAASHCHRSIARAAASRGTRKGRRFRRCT